MPIKAWGFQCLQDFDLAKKYIESSDHEAKENLNQWKAILRSNFIFEIHLMIVLFRDTFIKPWASYLKLRNIEDGTTEPVFPLNYDAKQRDLVYKSITPREKNWPGSNGAI